MMENGRRRTAPPDTARVNVHRYMLKYRERQREDKRE